MNSETIETKKTIINPILKNRPVEITKEEIKHFQRVFKVIKKVHGTRRWDESDLTIANTNGKIEVSLVDSSHIQYIKVESDIKSNKEPYNLTVKAQQVERVLKLLNTSETVKIAIEENEKMIIEAYFKNQEEPITVELVYDDYNTCKEPIVDDMLTNKYIAPTPIFPLIIEELEKKSTETDGTVSLTAYQSELWLNLIGNDKLESSYRIGAYQIKNPQTNIAPISYYSINRLKNLNGLKELIDKDIEIDLYSLKELTNGTTTIEIGTDTPIKTVTKDKNLTITTYTAPRFIDDDY